MKKYQSLPWLCALLLIVVSACASEPEATPLPTVQVITEPTRAPTSVPEIAAESESEGAVEPSPVLTETMPAAPTATPVPTATPLLTWAQLKNATYVIPQEMGGPEDGLVPMENGFYSFTVVPGSASESRFLLYPGVAFGDMDGDGVEDASVVIINISPGTGTFYHLVPVINAGGQPRSLNSSFIGDRVVVERLTVGDNRVNLLFRTYRPEEPFGSTPTLLVNRQYALVQESLEQQTEEVLNAEDVVNEVEFDKTISIELPAEGGTVSLTGATGPFGLDEYELPVSSGQTVTVAVISPNQDTFLSIFGMDSFSRLVPAQDEENFWSGVITETESLAVNIFSIGSETAYILDVATTAPPPAEPVAEEPTAPDSAPPPPPASTEGGNVVSLTFDDGPASGYTAAILDLLAQYNAQATFFLLGINSASYGDTLEAVRQGGHALANHTYSHTSLAGMSQEHFNTEVLSTAEVLGPDGVRCMRPPYGATDSFTRAYAAELGYEVIMWNIDTMDWSQPGTQAIVSSVLDYVYPGAIVLMHDGGGMREQTVEALGQILASLSSQGYVMAPMCR